MSELSLFERLGGAATLDRVHQALYERLFTDPWLQGFFLGKDKARLISQQTSFMTAALGGPNGYIGKTPRFIHQHMFITEEVFEARAALLRVALEECGIAADLRQEWLAVDRALKYAVIKRSREECVTSGLEPQILEVPRPTPAP